MFVKTRTWVVNNISVGPQETGTEDIITHRIWKKHKMYLQRLHRQPRAEFKETKEERKDLATYFYWNHWAGCLGFVNLGKPQGYLVKMLIRQKVPWKK